MDNCTENNNLLEFEGIINRRNYIVNILLVETLIQSLVATPLFFVALTNSHISGLILGDGIMPKWWNFVLFITGLLSSIMYMPSVVKRIRDIMGLSSKDNIKSFAIFTFVVLMLGLPVSFSNEFIFSAFKLFGLGILISLAFIEGKITGSMPKSEIAQFNWGAFIGTWIWGLFNKSYITLWALPLSFTMGALPFYIICGLKGNEWAYEKRTNKNIALFHAQQKLQTIIWTVAIPILSFMIFIVCTIGIYNFATTYSKNHPDFAQKALEHYVKTESNAAMSKFDKIELTKDEYKFYISPKKWAKAPYKEKVATFDMASGYVMLQTLNGDNLLDVFSGSTNKNIMNKIKIYSTFNDELLGEFYLDTKTLEKLMQDIKTDSQKQNEVIQEIKKGYRFNSHPVVP